MFEVTMTAPNMNKSPTIGFEFCNDEAAVHFSIIHAVHTPSIFLRKPSNAVLGVFALCMTIPPIENVTAPLIEFYTQLRAIPTFTNA